MRNDPSLSFFAAVRFGSKGTNWIWNGAVFN